MRHPDPLGNSQLMGTLDRRTRCAMSALWGSLIWLINKLFPETNLSNGPHLGVLDQHGLQHHLLALRPCTTMHPPMQHHLI